MSDDWKISKKWYVTYSSDIMAKSCAQTIIQKQTDRQTKKLCIFGYPGSG